MLYKKESDPDDLGDAYGGNTGTLLSPGQAEQQEARQMRDRPSSDQRAGGRAKFDFSRFVKSTPFSSPKGCFKTTREIEVESRGDGLRSDRRQLDQIVVR
ncbi:UNVERIFIED_CONTAM: hypothetical protein HHA_454160 [Hammondia hammondi]|eukprot:XP_008887540.1 hypothetical protein HHA_454160 [Hammondia hammondi]